MSSGIDYNYDFNYSLHLEGGAFKSMPSTDDKDLIAAAHQLYQYQIIAKKDIHKFYLLLIKQKPFIKLGKQIQELIEIQFEIIAKKNFKDMDQQYFLREQLCQSIREVNAMLGRQRQYYINLIILFLMIILLRVIHKKHQIQMQKPILFHFIHWELKGQHSTNHFYESLLQDIVNQQMLIRYETRKPMHEQSHMNQSLSFKQIQSSINIKRSISNSSFGMILNKQNQAMNHSHMQTFKAFKKMPSNSNNQFKSMRPITFESCMKANDNI